MKKFLLEYKEFINRGDVVVVAIGLVMALYFKAIVDQIIAALITPLIALIFGESNIAAIGFSISDTFFPIGLVFSALIDFLATNRRISSLRRSSAALLTDAKSGRRPFGSA